MSKIEKYVLECPHKEYRAMAFWRDNFSDAYKCANKFAGEGGRIATLPDIIDARIDGPELFPPLSFYMHPGSWSQYFTTFSGEYFGYSKAGNPLIVVAHNVGPLSTPEGVEAAYKSPLRSKRNGSLRGEGRIPRKEFWDLIDGKYGSVAIVDFKDYIRQCERPFMRCLTADQALIDPVVQARLGSRFEEYILKHSAKTNEWANHENSNRADGKVEMYGTKITEQIGCERFNILTMYDSTNNRYFLMKNDDAPMAHLLIISQLNMRNGDSLHSDIECNSGLDSIRLVGIRGEDPVDDICPSVSIDNETIARYLPKFLVPSTSEVKLPELMEITNFGRIFFTESVNHEGENSGEIEYRVMDAEKINEPLTFTTDVKDNYQTFSYALEEVAALAPPGANAFQWKDKIKIEDGGHKHSVPIQFYKVSVDTTQKIPTHKELNEDFDTLMWVATRQ